MFTVYVRKCGTRLTTTIVVVWLSEYKVEVVNPVNSRTMKSIFFLKTLFETHLVLPHSYMSSQYQSI